MVTNRTFWTAVAIEIALLVGLAAASAQYSMNQLLNYGTAAIIKSFSINDVYNVKAYGALGDGSTDDWTAITAARDAACAAANSIVVPKVYFPFSNYKISKPLIMSCSTPGAMTFGGDDHSVATITPNFTGPAIVPADPALSTGSGPVLAAPLVGSVGNSIFWTAATDPYWLDLQEDLGATATPFLSGKSAATIRIFFKTPTSGRLMAIGFSSGGIDYWGPCNGSNSIGAGTATCIGAWGLWIDTDNKLHGYINTSNNGVQYVVSSGTVTTNAVQEADLEYDGAHIGVALNGTWGSTVVATGTIVQRPDEVTTLGVLIDVWPHITQTPIPFSGSLFDLEIAKVARRTLGTNYTQDSSIFTFDTNTIYGSAFSQVVNMPTGSSGGAAALGADYFNGLATTSTWAMIHNYGFGCCGGHYNIDHLNINGGSIAIDVLAADASLTHLRLTSQSYMGINTSPNASFNSNIDDVRGIPLSTEMGQLVIEGGITASTRVYTYACGQLCDYINNGSFRDMYVAAQSNTQWGVVCSQGCQLSDLIDDSENGGTCPALTLEKSPTQGATAFIIDGNSQIAPCNATIPPITIEGAANQAAASYAFNSTQIQWFGATNSIVHEVGGTANAPPTLTFLGDSYTSGVIPSIPYVDGRATIVDGNSLAGQKGVKSFGAQGDGIANDTVAIQAAITAACPAGTCIAPVYFPTGTYKVTSLNLTGLVNPVLFGDDSGGGFAGVETEILCSEAVNNTGNCLDWSGSYNTRFDHIRVIGASGAAPKVLVLMAKNTAGTQGFLHNWTGDTFINQGGDWGVYNYGGEQWNCVGCYFNGTPNKAALMLTVANTPAMTSAFTTLQTAPTSETVMHLSVGNFSTTSTTGVPIMFDTGSGIIPDGFISGYCNSPSTLPCIADFSAADTGAVEDYTLNLRHEPQGTTTNIGAAIKFAFTSLLNSHINVMWAPASTTTNPAISLAGGVNFDYFSVSFQPLIPTSNVIVCTGTNVLGTTIQDQYEGAGPSQQQNNCPGAAEILGNLGSGFGTKYKDTSHIYTPQTVLPPTPVDGETVYLTNASGCSLGTAVTATGATRCLVSYNSASAMWFPAGLAVTGSSVPTTQTFPFTSPLITGTSFWCSNCDPPTNPPTLCSSSFSKIGSNVRVSNGQPVCGF